MYVTNQIASQCSNRLKQIPKVSTKEGGIHCDLGREERLYGGNGVFPLEQGKQTNIQVVWDNPSLCCYAGIIIILHVYSPDFPLDNTLCDHTDSEAHIRC